MSDQEERLKKLEFEVLALREATANAILLATSATDIAYSLASTHPNPTALLHTFKDVSATTEGVVTYSGASDEQVQALSKRREDVIAFLVQTIQARNPA